MIKLNKYSRGLSLIELMVALTLSLMIMGGAITMLSNNKRVYKDQEELGRLQENARFAMEILIRDIRMAGYAGCVDDIDNIQNHLNGASDDDEIFNMTNPIEGSQAAGNWQPSNSADQVSTMVAGNDGITVRYLDPNGMSPTDKMPTTSANIEVTSIGDLEIGDIIGVADCESAEVFEITQFPSGTFIQHNTGATAFTGNATKVLQKRYGSDAAIIRFVANRYFIRNNASGNPSLYRQEVNGTVLELIEGIDSMQLLFGEDTGNDGIADQYVNASAVGGSTDWDKVVSVKLGLLVNGVEQQFLRDQDTTVYNVLGTNVGPFNDNRRRKIFVNTVQIRNRSN